MTFLKRLIFPKSAAGESDAKGSSPEQSHILDLLERCARHLLEEGDHVPVTAFVMKISKEIDLIDLGQGFAQQDDALTATLMQLVPLARAGEIIASGIMFQPGDAGGEKPGVLIFDIEQIERPRFFVTLTYLRRNAVVTFSDKTYKAVPIRLFAE